MAKSLYQQLIRAWHHWRGRLFLIALALGVLISGNDNPTLLEQVKARGKLVMLTVNGASTYYRGPEGDTGFEYDLALQFADYLGVQLEVITEPNISDLIPALENRRGDFIASNLSRSPERETRLRFSPSYEQVAQTVVHRRGTARPGALEDLAGGRLSIIAGTSYEALLEDARANGLHLEWQGVTGVSIEDLFDAISTSEIDYTIIDSNIFKLNQRFFPGITEAFNVGDPQPLAWATRPGDDDSVAQRMREFFLLAEHEGLLDALRARYYDHLERYEPVGTFTFMQQMRERLPEYRPLFEEAGLAYDLDWRLLAAIGYQESHWDPDAVSPTGVRGIMMLTRQTARQLGVDNRRDPIESIDGGARYVRSMMDRIPERVDNPDRLWLALAAYNIGLGHLEDARRLTQAQGGDPDRWLDVRERLPLLTQERYFRHTRFGYARGYQAVHYVENIRTYFEILVWMDDREHPLIVVSEERTRA